MDALVAKLCTRQVASDVSIGKRLITSKHCRLPTAYCREHKPGFYRHSLHDNMQQTVIQRGTENIIRRKKVSVEEELIGSVLKLGN